MKVINIILFIGIIFLISNCTDEQEPKIKYIQPEIKKKAVVQFDSLPGALYITRFDLDSDKNLYLFDDNSYSVKKYDTLGQKVIEIGKEGPGPGEFEENDYHYLKWTPSNLIVYNPEEHRLRFFDSSLNFIGENQFEDMFFDFDFNNKKEFAFSFLDHKRKNALKIMKAPSFDQKEVVYDLALDKRNLFYNILSLKFLNDDQFVGGHTYRNKIYVFSTKGTIDSEFSIPGWPAKSEVKEPYVPEKVMIQDITVAENDEIWILGGGYAKNRRKDIFVFNNKGKYKYTFTLPSETPQIEYMDGYLYTLNSERSNILRLKWLFRYVYIKNF